MNESAASSYVHVFDTTLRDGEQSPGATMTSREKLEVARALARLGVDVIEAFGDIKSTSRCGLGAGELSVSSDSSRRLHLQRLRLQRTASGACGGVQRRRANRQGRNGGLSKDLQRTGGGLHD